MSRWTAPLAALAGVSRSATREIEARTPVPLAASGSRWFGSGSGVAAWMMRAYLDVYSDDAVVHPIVSRLAESVASLEWKLWTRSATGDDQDRVQVNKHPVLDLLDHPNDFQTWSHIVEAGQQHFELCGETDIVLGFLAGLAYPLDMWLLRPDRLQPIPDEVEFLAGWIYTSPGSGEKIPLEPREVMRALRPDPNDPYRGKSPIPALLRDVGANTAMQEWRAMFFENSARPGGIIEVDKHLSDPEFEEMRSRWAEQHKGVSKAHRVALLEHGAKWVETGFSLKDMQIVELDSAQRDKALVAFGMPKSMLGIVEDVNRANAEAGEYLFAKWMTNPRGARWRSMLNTQLLPAFGKDVPKRYELDFENPVIADKEFELKELEAKGKLLVELVSEGYDSAEVLEMLDWPDLSREAPATPPPPPVMVPSKTGQPIPEIEPADPEDVFVLGPGVTATGFRIDMAMRWKVVGHPDDNCCDPCKGKIGTLYRNRESAYADYPGGAGYIKCVGAEYGNKCRCKVVKRREK